MRETALLLSWLAMGLRFTGCLGDASANQTAVVDSTETMELPPGVCPGQGYYERRIFHPSYIKVNFLRSGKVVSDIVGFLGLSITAIYIGVSNSQYKGTRHSSSSCSRLVTCILLLAEERTDKMIYS